MFLFLKIIIWVIKIKQQKISSAASKNNLTL